MVYVCTHAYNASPIPHESIHARIQKNINNTCCCSSSIRFSCSLEKAARCSGSSPRLPPRLSIILRHTCKHFLLVDLHACKCIHVQICKGKMLWTSCGSASWRALQQSLTRLQLAWLYTHVDVFFVCGPFVCM